MILAHRKSRCQMTRTIETVGKVSRKGDLLVHLPSDIVPGQHHVVLIIDQPDMPSEGDALNFPVDHVARWPANLSLRREDIYGDDGR